MYDSAMREIHLGDIVLYINRYCPAFGRVINISKTMIQINVYFRKSYKKHGLYNVLHGYYKPWVTPEKLLVLDGIDSNEHMLGELATHTTFCGYVREETNIPAAL